MKYLLKNGKVECSGSKKQLIDYVKENYAEEYWVREYGKLFDTDFGKFKFALETIGLQLSDKMSKEAIKKKAVISTPTVKTEDNKPTDETIKKPEASE